jgi:hypothetical protein
MTNELQGKPRTITIINHTLHMYGTNQAADALLASRFPNGSGAADHPEDQNQDHQP